MTKPARTETEVAGPAVVTGLHVQDFETSKVAGAPKAFRRHDGLSWLHKHRVIQDHQLEAGRRLQEDWQISKIEPCARYGGGGGGRSSTTLPDAVLDAGTRFKDAMAVLPQELVTLLTLFLLPEDHPFSLERCAAIVREDRRAASYGVRIGLTLLARHYGYCR